MPQKDTSRDRHTGGADKNRTTGAGQISTSDPIVNRGDERLSRRPPEQAVSFETNQRGTVSDELADPEGGLESQPAVPAHGNQTENDRHQHDRQPDVRKDHVRQESQDATDKRLSNAEGRPKKRNKHYAPPPAVAMNWKSLAITGVLALICGVAGAWGYSALLGAPKSDDQTKSQNKDADKSSDKKQKGKQTSDSNKAGSQGDNSASASQIVGFTSADDADALKKQLKHLDDRIDRLSQRIDGVTRPENQTPPVLHTLQTHLKDLAREMDELSGLPSRLERLEQQCNSLQQQLKTFRSQQSQAVEESDGASLTSPDLPPTSPPMAGDTDPTLALAIGLFEEGQYAQARRVLQRLQRTHPKDARVWYFSALATALNSGQWEGEAEKLADQGAACEQSGTLSKAEIDAALSVVTPRTGERWLAKHRGDTHHRQAKK